MKHMSDLAKMFVFILLDMMNALAPTICSTPREYSSTWLEISALSEKALELLRGLDDLGVIAVEDSDYDEVTGELITISVELTAGGAKIAHKFIAAAYREVRDTGCFGTPMGKFVIPTNNLSCVLSAMRKTMAR